MSACAWCTRNPGTIPTSELVAKYVPSLRGNSWDIHAPNNPNGKLICRSCDIKANLFVKAGPAQGRYFDGLNFVDPCTLHGCDVNAVGEAEANMLLATRVITEQNMQMAAKTSRLETDLAGADRMISNLKAEIAMLKEEKDEYEKAIESAPTYLLRLPPADGSPIHQALSVMQAREKLRSCVERAASGPPGASVTISPCGNNICVESDSGDQEEVVLSMVMKNATECEHAGILAKAQARGCRVLKLTCEALESLTAQAETELWDRSLIDNLAKKDDVRMEEDGEAPDELG